jgi:hypothetical protein
VDAGDPGEINGPGWRVFLDGVEQRFAFTADEEHGFVIRAKRGDDGQIVINRSDYEVERQTVHGVVRVERIP